MMMNDKRNWVAFYDHAKAKFKHQSLIEDYQNLYQEVEATRNKLKNTNKRKLRLLAEVRFLRRRYQYLMKNKSSNPPQEQRLVQPPRKETKPKSNTKCRRIPKKKEATLNNSPQISNLKPKARNYTRKNAALQVPNRNPVFNMNQKGTLHNVNEAALYNPRPILDSTHMKFRKEVAPRPVQVLDNPNERLCSGNGTTLREPSLILDLNHKEIAHSGRGSQASIIDLNQIPGEKDEVEDNCSRRGLVRGEIEEPLNDVKLSTCRNMGDGVSSSSRKRKVSWQDPVALGV